ncbi:branched-chain amino acid ABC transporter permease [Companilactobacillus sp. RD055328]|uniref:ABC transporter permease n=1 Tax=Companilactobacillus sp. RD055328 TaxID=2916634 RepID=UPI001FC80732|nr:ABC transporter permease [Companilactobacillus sp. RD055328]GKQ43211.1 branched-chain amino acid ABC transporter permease [Companilactobacillus sp. RD055328]
MNILVSTIGQGLIWSLLAIGLYITFRILDFPDMTVEGSFPLGAAIAVINIHSGNSIFYSMILAFVGGAIAGLVTALLYTKLKIPVLLSGILTMTALYSVNLRVLKKANLSLLNNKTIFSFMQDLPPNFNIIVIGIIFISIIILLLSIFLNTEMGQALIATGDNEVMAESLGVSTDNMKIIGLMVSNGLVALTGSLVAQQSGYADITMGIGVIVIGLAAIIIGEVAFGDLSLTNRIIAIVIGSIIYRLILLVVLQLGFNPNDLKLISAIILAICLALPTVRGRAKHLLKRGIK